MTGHTASTVREEPSDDSNDAVLLSRATSGDERAFANLVRRHVRAATLLAAQIVGERDAAEDIVQDAFLIVNDGASAYDRSRPFAPWFYGVVRGLARSARKREARRRRLWERWGTRETDLTTLAPSEYALGNARSRDVDNALKSLSPMQRACFELVSVKHLTISTVAAMHGIAESTVRQHVYRARHALQRSLSKDRP